MAENKYIFTIVVNNGKEHRYYGTFNNRQLMLNSLRENVDLKDAYIQGSTKKLSITPITIFNGFIGNGLTIYKDDKNGKPFWYIKVLMHQMNEMSPYFLQTRDEQEKQSRIF